MSELDAGEKALARLYMAGCFHQWGALPGAPAGPHRSALANMLPRNAPVLTNVQCEAIPGPGDCVIKPGVCHPFCRAAAHSTATLTAARRAADLARTCYTNGCTVEQVRGCARHLIVCVRAPHGVLPGCRPGPLAPHPVVPAPLKHIHAELIHWL